MIVIDEGEKNRIKKLLLKPTADLFDVAQAGVYEHMSTSSYLTFTVNHPQGKGATERSKSTPQRFCRLPLLCPLYCLHACLRLWLPFFFFFFFVKAPACH
jgi:hypothetical protein